MSRETDNLMSKLFLIGICIVLLIIFCSYRESKWNNGYCECGGKWEYQQAIGHEYTTNYLYKCDKCGRVEEFGKLR